MAKGATEETQHNNPIVNSVQTLTIEDVRMMETVLRKLDKGWAALLAEKLGREERYIYNVTNGGVTNNVARMEFIMKGNELKKELEKRQEQVVEVLNEIKSSLSE